MVVDETKDKLIENIAEKGKKPVKPTKVFRRAEAYISKEHFSETEAGSRESSLDSRQSWKPKRD
jgi:hypothetical protein